MLCSYNIPELLIIMFNLCGNIYEVIVLCSYNIPELLIIMFNLCGRTFKFLKKTGHREGRDPGFVLQSEIIYYIITKVFKYKKIQIKSKEVLALISPIFHHFTI